MKTSRLKITSFIVPVSLTIILLLAACSNPTGSSTGGASGTASDPTVSYSVSYDANGADGGEIPLGPQSYEHGKQITVLANSSLQKANHSFIGWNSDPDGGGSTWSVGATLIVDQDLTLYAQWTDDPVSSLSYHANGADSGEVPVGENSYPQGQTVTVLENSGDLHKDGHSFLRWNTRPDGSGGEYAPGASLVIGAADVVLYAQWTENPVFTLSYDANGADSGEVPVGPLSYEEGDAITVLGNTGNLQKTDHTFGGWIHESEGDVTHYRAGDALQMPAADVTLYAQWNPPLADELDVQEAFNAVVEETIVGDAGNGFQAIDGEDGGYVYTKTGGGSLRFWQINASGTISFDVTLANVGGGSTEGDVKVFLVDADGTRAEDPIDETTVSLGIENETTVEFAIPDSAFEIDFQGGRRDWEIRNFSLALTTE